MMIISTIDSLPRLRISDSLMKVILWALGQCGADDVPSFKRLRKFQEELQAERGIASREFKSYLGNVFYMNDIRQLIAKVMASINHHLSGLTMSHSKGLCQPVGPRASPDIP